MHPVLKLKARSDVGGGSSVAGKKNASSQQSTCWTPAALDGRLITNLMRMYGSLWIREEECYRVITTGN